MLSVNLLGLINQIAERSRQQCFDADNGPDYWRDSGSNGDEGLRDVGHDAVGGKMNLDKRMVREALIRVKFNLSHF
jgi:hypothetical protein